MSRIRLFRPKPRTSIDLRPKEPFNFHLAGGLKNNTEQIIREIDRLKDVNALIPYPSEIRAKGTPLISLMASHGRLDIVKYLLENKHADLTVLGNSEYSVLRFAIQYQKYSCALYLLNQGAAIYPEALMEAIDNIEASPMTKKQQLEVVKELLKRGAVLKGNPSKKFSEYTIESLDKLRIELKLEETTLSEDTIGLTMSYLY